MSVKGDQATVRAINRSLVLNLLRQHQSLGRQELAELTHLSAAAITGVVSELIGEGWVVEARSGIPRGGRPPVLLEIAYEAWCAAGVKVMEDHLEVVLTDLRTEMLARQQIPLSELSPKATARDLSSAVQTLVEQSGYTPERLVGVGVGMAGVVDSERGICRYSPFLHWRNVPLKDLLEEKLLRPVWVDNDVSALAAAEMLFGHGQSTRHLVVVTVGRGIGAGLVLDGRIYRGHAGGAGELGHTVSQVGGRRCECGKLGCLEAYASEPALLAQAREQFPEFGKKKTFTITDLIAATPGHKGATALLGEAGSRLGVALANIVNLFNPERIVIAGEGVRLGEAYFNPMQEALKQNVFNGLADQVSIHIDPWGDEMWARGAAGLAIQREVFVGPSLSS